MADTGKQGFSTRCIHAGESLDVQGGIHMPLYNHSTFAFENTEKLLDVVEGRNPDGNLYTRYGLNPTIRGLEKKCADLEGGAGCLAFSSGMAAEAATFLAHCNAGDHIICIGDVYGGTYDLLNENLPTLGIKTTFVLGNELADLPQQFRATTKLVFFETPTNPNLEVLDIRSIAAVAKEHGVLTVVDNTFASPVNQQPLELDADIVVHSATKYLGGHSDLTGGLVISSAELLAPIWVWRKNLGQMMAPEVAFLLARSLRTLAVRVKAQNQSAQQVAKFLQQQSQVLRVNYPGLKDFAGHAVASKQMSGFGGMLSFVFDGDAAATAALVDHLQLFSIAASLGGVESLVTQPITTTHYAMLPEERSRRGIPDGMVRLSIGLEDVTDLIADLRQALG
ncbi:MAG: PLP-dependent aspartate aminotransferase family protein [Geopsychrobacter sp.]|nr:PLP-dependent aspartate aminotransferase family protein [Geopsychrobacter sp.]